MSDDAASPPSRDLCIQVPSRPSLDFFAMLVRKGELLSQQVNWSAAQVAAGQMTEEQRLEHLHRLWEMMMVPLEVPPLPDTF